MKTQPIKAVLFIIFLYASLNSCGNNASLTVLIQPSESGSVIISPEGTSFKRGTEITITAIPGAGYNFYNWTGDITESENPVTIVIQKSTGIVANFTTETANPMKGYNAYALIDGVDFGYGTETVSNLRKQIYVNSGPNSDFEVPSAIYATRISATSDYLRLAIPIKNISEYGLKYINLDEIYLLDSDGNPIHVNELMSEYIHGSVGKVSSTYYSNACLAPGETGYAFIIESDSYTGTEGIKFNIYSEHPAPEETNAAVIPQSYSFSGSDMTIYFKNTGSKKVDIQSYIYYLCLDADNIPVTWSLTDDNLNPATGVLDVGNTGSISDNVYYYGTGTKILVFVDYDVFDESSNSISQQYYSTKSVKDFNNKEEYIKYINSLRNEREAYIYSRP
ncbi:MAG: hypothetical protein GXP33_11250 [Spirochaetes bacterium]|nr:hypothetical protein [Spirochaetota bacterium]